MLGFFFALRSASVSNMTSLIRTLPLALFFFVSSSQAFETGSLRFGLEAGQITLLQDLGKRSGSATGLGIFGSYASDENVVFEVAFLKSEHTKLRHIEVPVGFHYYFTQSLIQPYATAGLVFISNVLDESPVELSSSGFGVYLGGGADYEVIEHGFVGLQLRYVKGFEQTVQLSDGSRFSSLQDNTDLLLRLMWEI